MNSGEARRDAILQRWEGVILRERALILDENGQNESLSKEPARVVFSFFGFDDLRAAIDCILSD
jgi:hypothetical protein